MFQPQMKPFVREALVNRCVHVSNVKSFQELHFFQISGSQAREELWALASVDRGTP